MNAMHIFVITSVVCLLVAATDKNTNPFLLGLGWPVILFIGMPAVIGWAVDLYVHKGRQTHERPATTQEKTIWLLGVLAIAAMVLVAD